MEADNRERRRRLAATKITDDVNAERVNQLRALRVKVPGSGTGEDLEGAKEVSGCLRVMWGAGVRVRAWARWD